MSQRGGLVVVGLNHRTTPLELRERLAIEIEQWQSAWPAPSVLLTTCNRLEVYAWAEARAPEVAHRLARALAHASGVAYGEIAPCLFQYTDTQAVVHLVRVAAGLDSLVLGDEQIRGQVRDACDHAGGSASLPPPLGGIFTRALEAGRKIRGKTVLGRHPSVAEAAIRVARDILDSDALVGKQALILGAGAMAEAGARELLGGGWQLTLLNRTPEHAARLARSLGPRVQSEPLDALPQLLTKADLLVCATASRLPVVNVGTVRQALMAHARPLLILDIALPRDVEPEVRALPGVRLIDLSDLEKMCPVSATTRKAGIEEAESLAVEETARIDRWLRMRTVVPTIVDLRRQGEQIRALELHRAERRLRDLTPDQREAVDAVTGAIVNKLLHGPTVLLRAAGVGSRSARRCRVMVQEVLRLDGARHLRNRARPIDQRGEPQQ